MRRYNTKGPGKQTGIFPRDWSLSFKAIQTVSLSFELSYASKGIITSVAEPEPLFWVG